MENALTLHFKIEDSVKDLLFNATTKRQEDVARDLLQMHKKEAENIYINEKVLVSDYQSNN